MTLSARNHLPGTVEEITLGGVMAHVVVRVGTNVVESVITRRSAEEMKLKKGDKVTAIIKSTEVMLEEAKVDADERHPQQLRILAIRASPKLNRLPISRHLLE